MKTYEMSKALEKALNETIDTKEKQQFNEELHKLIAKELELDYETSYKTYYCLINKFKTNNDYYNFLFNEYLNLYHCNKVVECTSLLNLCWTLAKECGTDTKTAYSLLKTELAEELGIRKTSQLKQYLSDCSKAKNRHTVYLKVFATVSLSDTSSYNEPCKLDNYAELNKEDMELLATYLKKVLTSKQFTYLEGYLKGKYPFSKSGKMSKALISKLKNDRLLKFLKVD